MSVTVYNPTTGRYVTTLSTSAGSQKQASTAALKSKAGGQAAPLTPSANAVQVSLSTTAKSLLAGTAKLKANELFTKMEQPGYSPSDLTGVTLYLDSNINELLPPAVPGSRKTFDLATIKNSSDKTLPMSMADMRLKTSEYKSYNDTSIEWYGLGSDGKWVSVSDANLPKSFDAAGDASVKSAQLLPSTLGFKSLRADFSRVPNYEKLLNLLTAQGGRKLVDVRAANDAPVKLDGETYAKIQSNLLARDLLKVTSNFSLNFITGLDGKVASDMDPDTLADFKKRIEVNQATKVTIDGQSSPVTLTPDVVQSLGAKTLARYSGKITVDASAESILAPDKWENLRVLNNYRDIAINLNLGVPSSKFPIGSLSTTMSKLSYQQFVGGFNLVNAITVKPSPINLVSTEYTAATKTQKIQIEGQYQNGDTVKISLLGADGRAVELNAGPLTLPNGASAEQQASALTLSLNTALALAQKSDPNLLGISISRQGNQLLFTWPNSGSVPTAPLQISVPSANGALSLGVYDSRNRSQRIQVSEGFLTGKSFALSINKGDGNPVSIQVGPLTTEGSNKAELTKEIVSKVGKAILDNGTLDLAVKADGEDFIVTWNTDSPAQMPPVSFQSFARATEGNPTFGVELTNVPPSAVESLTAYSQVYGLNVKGSADQLINNSDKLNKLISNGFVKTVQLIDAKTGELIVAPSGQLPLTAAQAARSIPLLEKVGAGIITISDKKSSPSSYANFTNAAANNLVGGLRIVGTATEIQNSLQGLSALARMGKIATLVMTGNNGRQTTIDNFDSSKLSALVVSLRQGG